MFFCLVGTAFALRNFRTFCTFDGSASCGRNSQFTGFGGVWGTERNFAAAWAENAEKDDFPGVEDHQRDSKTPLLACGEQWYGWLGRHPRTQATLFGTVHFKHHHQRNPKTRLLACGVPQYGWQGRHPRTQPIFFCIVQFKHQHQRNPKTCLLACGVPWYGW